MHHSKSIIIQQRQPAKCRLHFQTGLLTGNGSKKVPSEKMEKQQLAKCLHCGTRQPSLISPFPHSPTRGKKNLLCIHARGSRHQSSQGQRPWPMGLAPRIPGLTYHPGHCDDCSFFSPKCSETCDSGWLASAWWLGFAGLVQIELHQVSSKDGSLTGGRKVSQLRTWY